MRIFSWNVNGLRAALRKGFEDWLAQTRPDVLAIQELRVRPEQLEKAHPGLLARLRDELGYTLIFNPAVKGGYSGTATFSLLKPDEQKIGLDLPHFDEEGRMIMTRFGDLWVLNGYFPNGRNDLSRVPYKLEFYEAVRAQAEAMRAAGQRVVICGDWNTAHHPIDLKNWKANQKSTGFLPEERAALDVYEQAGWVDAFRTLHPELAEQYTWWSQRGGARERNVGWRIDYHWVNAEMWPSVESAHIHPEVMCSDHCPIELKLRAEGS